MTNDTGCADECSHNVLRLQYLDDVDRHYKILGEQIGEPRLKHRLYFKSMLREIRYEQYPDDPQAARDAINQLEQKLENIMEIHGGSFVDKVVATKEVYAGDMEVERMDRELALQQAIKNAEDAAIALFWLAGAAIALDHWHCEGEKEETGYYPPYCDE